MSMLLVGFAFLSFSAAQADQAGTLPSGAVLSADNRDQAEGANNTEGVDANGERRICRRITASRTHMYRRVCMTARQWRQYDDDNG